MGDAFRFRSFHHDDRMQCNGMGYDWVTKDIFGMLGIPDIFGKQ